MADLVTQCKHGNVLERPTDCGVLMEQETARITRPLTWPESHEECLELLNDVWGKREAERRPQLGSGHGRTRTFLFGQAPVLLSKSQSTSSPVPFLAALQLNSVAA